MKGKITVTCTAESLTLLWLAQRSHLLRCANMKFWQNFSGVIDSAVMCTVKSLTTLWLAQWSHWLRCANMTLLWLLTSSWKTYIGQLSYTIPITFTHTKWELTWDGFFVTAESLTKLWQKSAITQPIFSANTDPYWKRL
jgi:hypothetical protein